MHTLKAIREKLNISIKNTVEKKEEFVIDNKKDFVRTSKLSFEKMLRITLQIEGQPIGKELSAYFDYNVSMPSPSAFCQKRSKIKFKAFQYLFQDFVKSCLADKNFKGYRLLAVDGSQLHIPKNESDSETFIFNGKNKEGWNRLHINAVYDLQNHIYINAVITPGKETAEQASLLKMLETSSITSPFILIADRGYESYDMIYHLLTKNIPFVFRVRSPKSNGAILNKASLPEESAFDIDFTLKVASSSSYGRKQAKKEITEQGYRVIAQQNHPFLSKEQKTYIFDTFRVVKLQLSSGEEEYLITNLSTEKFTKEDIEKLYAMRWGIETSFRELKYDCTLLQVHSKKVEYIKQEIYAKLTMYNFSRMITESLNQYVPHGKKYEHKTNFSLAVLYCKQFFLELITPPQLKELVLRFTVPIRPDRSYERDIKKKQPKSFQYRIA